MNVRLLIAALLVLSLASLASAGLPSTKVTFDNGLEAIFVENHSSPMITSIVFVNAGARYENQFNNGATHFLEHLLFDGTKTKSQSDLDDLIERHGGYINAFTRKDLTAYLVLMPTDYIDYGLDVQSDQLFNSILPAEQFPKERKVVNEEIRQTHDRIDDLVDDFHQSVVYAGTPYARPVLGYENLINTISREELLSYYQTYYAPNNMIALVIGDFKTADMVKKYKQFFGAAPARAIPPVPEFKVTIPNAKNIVTREMEGAGCYLSFTSKAPLWSDPDYFAFYVLNELLNTQGVSPLLNNLSGADGSLTQSVSASINTQKDFSTYDISIKTDSVKNVQQVIDLLNRTMEQTIADWEPTAADVKSVVTSAKTSEVYLKEKLHYYGFQVAPLMVATGYDFIDNMTTNLEKVKPSDVKRAAAKYFSVYNYQATVVTPIAESKSTSATEMTSEYLHEILPNGLEVIIKSNPYSQVQAFMVLGKNRAASEPVGKEGITDFVNRMLTHGSKNYTNEQMSRALAAIGANLTTNDNPYIPYDDRYTSRQFSFLKFETISDFTDQGIDLLAELVKNATFPDSEVEQVRSEVMSVLGMQSGSTSDQAKNVYYGLLFKDTRFTSPETGTMRSVGAITAEDLRAHYNQYYAPNNLILAVCTDVPPQQMLAKLTAAFGDMPRVETIVAPTIAPVRITGETKENIPMEKKQAYMYIGNAVCGAGDPDAVALRVAVDILSTRLGKVLREQRGLAYRVGAGVGFDKDFGWFSAAMGTGVENYSAAKNGILQVIDSMRTVDVSAEELERSVNSLWGSQLTARLSRINQAYYMAVNQFLVGKYDVEDDLISAMKAVTSADIKRVAQKYLDTKNYVLATVGAPE
ncbi:MAG: pitrilysin family protein [Candidatus Zixiibacteriota bacterium]